MYAIFVCEFLRDVREMAGKHRLTASCCMTEIKNRQLRWKRKLANVKSLKADVSGVSPSSERLEIKNSRLKMKWFNSWKQGGKMLNSKLKSKIYPKAISTTIARKKNYWLCQNVQWWSFGVSIMKSRLRSRSSSLYK